MGRPAHAPLDELTASLTRLTGLLLRSSGEGAHLIERVVGTAAGAYGGETSLLLVPEAAVLTVAAADRRARTVTVHGFPEVFRLDQAAALKPLLADVAAGRLGVAEADRRLARIEAAPAADRTGSGSGSVKHTETYGDTRRRAKTCASRAHSDGRDPGGPGRSRCADRPERRMPT
ncbi:threonine/serine exporter family protein [Streptomyces sp. SID8381]|uniref:threonine/serine exporter family protein n=1 Tax=unclassified Streptomyces TaxID=2593676 RepID=UPI000373A7D9|nr:MULTISPECIES: threonine/serine exporter family protein [unclassified Streptomyces]MYX27151.1 threonine/serine exporter family protein [Streptomyces sp. SID8381]